MDCSIDRLLAIRNQSLTQEENCQAVYWWLLRITFIISYSSVTCELPLEALLMTNESSREREGTFQHFWRSVSSPPCWITSSSAVHNPAALRCGTRPTDFLRLAPCNSSPDNSGQKRRRRLPAVTCLLRLFLTSGSRCVV